MSSRPLSGRTSPAMVRKVVVFPTELGPNSAKKEPSVTSNERLRKAIAWPKDFEIPERRSAGLRASAIATSRAREWHSPFPEFFAGIRNYLDTECQWLAGS